MRISDWSSDVCSSDLASRSSSSDDLPARYESCASRSASRAWLIPLPSSAATRASAAWSVARALAISACVLARTLLRRASADRSEERRVGKSVSVRVDLGGRRFIKKKKSIHKLKELIN